MYMNKKWGGDVTSEGYLLKEEELALVLEK